MPPERLDLTSDPIIIALRRHMKGVFLRELDRLSSREPLEENLSIVIYGSTLMRELAVHHGAVFPFPGVKSSDIDIGAYLPDGQHLNPEEEVYVDKVCPLIRDSIVASGFSVKSAANRAETKFKSYNPEEIAKLDNNNFCGDFYVIHKYMPDEVRTVLGKQWHELGPLFSNEPVEVHLSISSHQKHFPMIMRPIAMYGQDDVESEKNQSQLFRADRYDMLAGKLARCFTPHFKPTDLIDIYNLRKGTLENSEKPVLELGQPGMRDHRPVLRLMVLHYLMMSNEGLPDVENSQLLDVFLPSAENIRKFSDALKEQVASHRLGAVLEKAVDIFASSLTLLQEEIFPPGLPGEKRYGPLHLREEEAAYLLHYYGRRAPNDRNFEPEAAKSPISGITDFLNNLGLGKLLQAMHIVGEKHEEALEKPLLNAPHDYDGDRLKCRMELEMIRPFYATVEKLYPRIFPNLRRHDLLLGMMNERVVGKCNPQALE